MSVLPGMVVDQIIYTVYGSSESRASSFCGQLFIGVSEGKKFRQLVDLDQVSVMVVMTCLTKTGCSRVKH